MQTTHHITLPQKCAALVRHIRVAQLLVHLAAATIGALLALQTAHVPTVAVTRLTATGALLALIITLSWVASVMINDYHDRLIDRISNPTRPLVTGTISPETYRFSSYALHTILPFLAFLINPVVALFTIAYLALSLAYNTPPLRLKRLPLVGTFVMGLALQMIIFAGYALVAPNHLFHTYPFSWRDIAAGLGIFALLAPLKDFKDIAGDRAHGIRTLPVLLGERGARIVVAGGIGLLSFYAAVFAAPVLTPSAAALLLLCSAFAIGVLFASEHATLITPRALLWWILLPASVFGLFLMWHAPALFAS